VQSDKIGTISLINNSKTFTTMIISTLLAAEGLAQLGCGLGAGIATIGAGLGIGKIGGSAMDAIARQPEATGKIQTNMILTSAFVEGCALFAIAACAFLI
jgi:F-type H+-transporting ATPase subunit c